VYKDKVGLKKIAKNKIRKRIRKKMSGTSERPRVLVVRSNRYLYVQAVDDLNGKVMASASTLEKGFKEKIKNTKNQVASKALGEMMVGRLKKMKVKTIVFDRGFHPYHGRIKTLAEAIRKGGLVF
jgi:large subunit ribosomal protein L18